MDSNTTQLKKSWKYELLRKTCLIIILFLYGFIVNGQTFSSSSPVANDTQVAVNANIVMTFSSAITLSSSNTIIMGSQTGLINGVFSGGGTTVNTFNPTNDFKEGEQITVQLITASGGPTVAYNFNFRILPLINTVDASTPFQEKVLNADLGIIDVAVGDMDNDGDLDLVTVSINSEELVWYQNDGAADPTFTAQTALYTGTSDDLISVVLGDADNDGDLDIFFGGRASNDVLYVENQGAGSFAAATTVSTGNANRLSTVFLGDLDGDQYVDVLVSSENDNTVGWYKNNGNGTFGAETTITTTLNGAFSVKVGDMDNDGDLDVIAASHADDIINWYANDGSGVFGTAQLVGNTGIDGVISIFVGDIDGDNDLDVVSASLFEDSINWFQNNGASFTGSQVYKNNVTTPNSNRAVHVDLQDVDGDGDLDILWAADGGAGTIAWSRNDGNGASWTTVALNTGVNRGYSVDGADLNGDGNIEIIGTALGGSDRLISFIYNINSWIGATDTDWDTESNWSLGAVPTATTTVNVTTNTNAPVVGAGHAVNELNILSPGAVTINGSGSLTATDGTTINHGGSLVVDGSYTGALTYNLDIPDTNWYLIAAPVTGEQYDDAWITTNSVASGTGNNRGIGTYTNTTDSNGDWNYFQAGNPAENFTSAQGYSILRTASGNIGFIGSLQTSDQNPAITANDLGGANENRWNLIGNPFPSYIDINAFLTLPANALALTDTHQAVYVWNGTAYIPITSGYVHPGQGFFVNSDVASTSVAVNKNMLSHQTGVIFYRNSSNNFPKLTVHLSGGTSPDMYTEIQYREGKTRGLDPGFDLGSFTGTASDFQINTHLLEGSTGIDFAIQALPYNPEGLEDEIIPLSITATSGTALTFHISLENLPANTKVYLEDIETNTFTRLDEVNTSYAVTLDEAVSGIGRFYLHTNASTLGIDETMASLIKIYVNDRYLRIQGLSEIPTEVAMYDLLGKQVVVKEFKGTGNDQIALPKELSKGMYLVRLTTPKGKLSKKIWIE